MIGQHHKNAPRDKVSYLKYIRLEYEENTFEVFIGGKVIVNGRKVNLPYVNEEVGITIGNQVFGFTVRSEPFLSYVTNPVGADMA